MNDTPIITCAGLSKTFETDTHKVSVLNNVNFALQRGEQVAIVGPSGSGKSTLLQLLGGLDNPTTGTVHINGEEIHEYTEQQRCRLRNRSLGFVYQFHHLLPEFTALENVSMPLLIQGIDIKEARERAQEMLTRVGLEERLKHKPSQLSGGERQRTAIARGLVNHPDCLLADEPTGNLDAETADTVYRTMCELNESMQTSLLIVTHDMNLVKKMDRVYTITNGVLTEVNQNG